MDGLHVEHWERGVLGVWTVRRMEWPFNEVVGSRFGKGKLVIWPDFQGLKYSTCWKMCFSKRGLKWKRGKQAINKKEIQDNGEIMS